ncbi:Sensor histidine kinase RcsC [Candidatus Magnetaquicoccaceae bacterium FCR-1]|uniref:histidine kinase n=1 Tax=Candidatus Magnetaquiglobus chichijimensis TaxID=3141448 RepID=A0ABQ0C6G6_9PROT
MSLNGKLLRVVLLVAVLFIGISGLVQRFVIYPSFERLDEEHALENGRRSVQAIHRELHHLGLMAQDWAFWDDTYRFIEDQYPEYLSSNLAPEIFANVHVDVLFYYNQAGDVVWGHVIDDRKDIHVWPEFPVNRPDHPLRNHPDPLEGHRSILVTERGLLLVATFAILTSDRKGPARGTLLMGRFLDEDLVKTLREQTGVAFQLWGVSEGLAEPERLVVNQFMGDEKSSHLLRIAPMVSHFYTLLPDADSRRTILLRADSHRDHAALGGRTIHWGLALQLSSAMVVLVVLMVYLRRIIIRPIRALTERIEAGDLSGMPAGADGGGSRDEIDILGHYKNALEKTIDERTHELRVARDEALEAARAKGEFLATMSHEIRTPMNVILGFSEILEQRAALTAEERSFLSAIRQAGGSLLGLINDILDLARVESGRFELEQSPFALRELIEGVHGLFVRMAKEKGLSMQSRIHPKVAPYLVGDRMRLRQVLVNLVGNALKFTDSGRIVVRAAELTRSERTVVVDFTVEDTGIGIPEEKRQTIYEMFTQVDSSSTRRHGGSGLGLAISIRLAGMMGGVIWSEDQPDATGTIFHFVVPLRIDTTDYVVAGEEEGSFRRAGQGVPMTILVADVAPENRRLLATILSQEGHRVEEARNGREVLDRLTRGARFDAILMDLQEPEGGETIRAIRRLESEREGAVASIIVLTAHASNGAREGCRVAGCDRFLTKPIRRTRLLAEIDALMADDGRTILSDHETG